MSSSGDFKKKEYIYLHGLFLEPAKYSVQKKLESYEDIEQVQHYNEYLEKDLKPRSIHRNKADHSEAFLLLADSITDFLEEDAEDIEL